MINLRSLNKLCSNPKKYLPMAINYLNTMHRRKIPNCDMYIIDFGSYSKLMERILKTKKGLKIVDFHGLTPIEFVDDKLSITALEKATKQLELLEKVDIILTHSKFIQDKVKKLAKNYIAPLALFSDILPNSYKTLKNKNTLNILFVGKISKHKGIHVLIDALSTLDIPFECNIVGDYSSYSSKKYFKKLKKQALSLKLNKKVKFLRGISNEKLQLEYKKADLFITASFHEGFCIPIIESMSFGIPVIGSDSSAIPSTIGKGGVSFKTSNPADLKNKITQLFYDKKKYEKLSKKALAESKKYTNNNYLKFYKELLRDYRY